MKKVYIVTGFTGEYADSQNWIVKAYLDEKKAKNHVKKLNSWYMKNKMHQDQEGEEGFMPGWPYESPPKCPYDDSCWPDYTGVYYDYFEVELGQ